MYYSPITTTYWYFSAAFWSRVAITALLLCMGIGTAVFLYKTDGISKRLAFTGAGLWGYLLLILFVTIIGRFPVETHPMRTAPFAAYRDFAQTGNPDVLRDIVINLLLFIPFAFLCAHFIDCVSSGRCKYWKLIAITFAAGASLTLMIECLQAATSIGTFDVDDLIHNCVGTLIGITLWILRDKLTLHHQSKKTQGGNNERSSMEK